MTFAGQIVQVSYIRDCRPTPLLFRKDLTVCSSCQPNCRLMMKYLLLLPPLALLPHRAAAQTDPAAPRHATVLDLTGATGEDGLRYASAAGWRLWGLDRGGRFQVGLGARASYYWAAENDFDRQNGPDASSANVLRVSQPRLLALNLGFHLRARVAGPVRVGFNLDALGASFGPERLGVFGFDQPGLAFVATAKPVQANILQGGDPDRGSLNSELYLSVALPRGLSVRGAWSHLVTAYQVDDVRYRRFRNLAALGLSYQLP